VEEALEESGTCMSFSVTQPMCTCSRGQEGKAAGGSISFVVEIEV
jgi:hypothetical protein